MDTPSRVGRYDLLERVGRGSMGVLYRGRDTILDREVAVKVMAADFSGDDDAHARFFREAKAAARLQHTNIVTIFEFGEHDETPFIVMEFLHGRSLAERLRQDPPLPLPDKLDTVIQLCAGLDFAHAQGVVHRDVKPGNVWLCDDGTVKLLDFGIAKAASSATTFSDVMGSPGYMSPEQVQGEQVDGRTDVFSAGVVLHELLSGRRPFEAESPTGVMLKIVQSPPEPLIDSRGSGYPPALLAAVKRALEKSPEARYQRAADLGRDLKAIRAGLPAAADATVFLDGTVFQPPVVPPAGPIETPSPARLAGRVRERRLPGAAAAVVTLGILLGIGAIAWAVWPAGAPASSIRPGPSPTKPNKPDPERPRPTNDRGADRAVVKPAPATRTLRVTSRPPAARIQVDGRDTGRTTPAEIVVRADAPPRRIQLELSGFATEDIRLTEATVSRGTVDVALSPRVVEPAVRVVASGDYAFEVMDRQRVLSAADTQHALSVSGLRAVQLRADRYFLNQTVRVDRSQSGVVRASAPPLGSITVYASGPMEDCKVYVDDRIVDSGSLPITNRALASGPHRVKLRCSRGDTDDQTVDVQPGQNASSRFPTNTVLRPR